MKISTKKLLNKFDYNTIFLNISNKNIKGVLNLSGFDKLIELNCSNNEITEIINIPERLKYLNCSFNKITKLIDLTDYYLSRINYKKNPLKELRYPLSVKPKKYPSGLTHLTFCNNYNQSINKLPYTLTHLTFGNDFNQPIDNLPNSLINLILGDNFNQQIDNLPNSLINLTLNNYQEYSLLKLPNSINIHLNIDRSECCYDDDIIETIENLPNNVKIFNYGYNSNNNLKQAIMFYCDFEVKNNKYEFDIYIHIDYVNILFDYFQESKYKEEKFKLNIGFNNFNDIMNNLDGNYTKKLIENINQSYPNIKDLYDNFNIDIIENELENAVIEYYNNFYNKLNLNIASNVHYEHY